MTGKTLNIITGAAGFVSHCLIQRLLSEGEAVAGYDNMRRGTLTNIAAFADHPDFFFRGLDAADKRALTEGFGEALAHHSTRHQAGQKTSDVVVWHMAANSDILAGINDPDVDLHDTFLTSHATLAAMRAHGLRKLAFASTSAVYGALQARLHEDIGPLFPISNYGAMKLASEASISAAAESHLERAWIFRFPNVVGAFATHGVIYDFARKLRRNPQELEVLGNGTQQKAYLLVDELVDAMRFIQTEAGEPLNCFNIGPSDEGATVRFIAEEMVRVASPKAAIRYTGGDRGWVGDVPRFTYSTEKLQRLGWSPKMSSENAIRTAIPLIWQESE